MSPPPASNRWKPWKILLVSALFMAVTLRFVDLTARLFSKAQGRQERPVAEKLNEHWPKETRRALAEPIVAAEAEDDLRNSESGATLPHNPYTVPTNLSKNAILGSSENAEKSLPGDDLFKDEFIPRLILKIPKTAYDQLVRRPRTYVRATIEEGTNIYSNVAIHLKGGPGSFRELQSDRHNNGRDNNDMPAFTVNFEHFVPGQKFHGLKKIHLNNSVQDDTRISEKISRELFEAAGVPAPRAGNALVTFGDSTRMYVLVEGINKQFLKRYFKDPNGNVYDGHSGSDVTDDLPVNDGEKPRDKSRLRALAGAVRQGDLSVRLAALEKTLDVDRFLSFIAMEAILCHWDGYTIGRNNFRIFHDRDTDRMVFLPQGLDQILGRRGSSLFPEPSGMVARAVLEIPELRRRYRDRVAQLSTNVFRVEAITNRIQEVAAKIEAVLAEGDPDAARQQRERAANLSRRFQQRAAYLQSQIFPAARVNFSQSSIVALNSWSQKIDLGQAHLTQENDEQGNPTLHISSSEGCTASWRTRRLLDKGNYRFEARIKTQGVVLSPDDARAGAGLRISRYRTGQKNSGDKDWTPVAFEFQVPVDQSEVELVCELRANKGDVWFDLKSLKLKQI